MGTLIQDWRYGLRMLRKSPGFTAVAILTAGLGIAANVTVFSLVDGLFLRSVPAKNPKRLVRILAPENDGGGYFSIPEFLYLRNQTKTVEELTADYSSTLVYFGKRRDRRSSRSRCFEQLFFHARIAAIYRPVFYWRRRFRAGS